MHAKGVASVRSPVRNLVQSSASATHEAFVDAVIKSFREEYAINEEVSQSSWNMDCHLCDVSALTHRSHSRVSCTIRRNTSRMNILKSACPSCRQVYYRLVRGAAR